MQRIWLPLTMIASGAGALAALFRRAARPSSEPGQASRLERLNTGKWTRDLLKHLEWRRLEELCAAYFEELGFRTGLTHDRGDGAVDISLYAAGAETACILVHCKAWDAYPIGIKPLHELQGAMTSANVAEGVMVTAGRFTLDAVGFAAKPTASGVKRPAVTITPSPTLAEVMAPRRSCSGLTPIG